jgi:hypothetical protein
VEQIRKRRCGSEDGEVGELGEAKQWHGVVKSVAMAEQRRCEKEEVVMAMAPRVSRGLLPRSPRRQRRSARADEVRCRPVEEDESPPAALLCVDAHHLFDQSPQKSKLTGWRKMWLYANQIRQPNTPISS